MDRPGGLANLVPLPPPRPVRRSRRLSSTVLVPLALLSGCASVTHPPLLPPEHIQDATLPGFPAVRYGYDQSESAFVASFQEAMRTVPADSPGVAVLALSGGGPNGAFGAGILRGWTESGQRPEFRVVTGVSTGALAAPFAFLGSAYDGRLERAYTTMGDKDVFIPRLARSLFRLLDVDSVSDTTPLTRTLAELIDPPMLNAIAVEHAKGRRLFVCTTELISGRTVFWDMTAIAASGHPEALDLFRSVLIASASVPIAFPPQYIEVEAAGRDYAEVHVDGGLSRQVFLHLNGARRALPLRPDGGEMPLTAYVIRNAKADPSAAALKPRLLPIALRTLDSLVRSQGVGDLHRIYGQTVAERAGYRLAVIPADFTAAQKGVFDSAYMRQVFELGLTLFREGRLWQHKPPHLVAGTGAGDP